MNFKRSIFVSLILIMAFVLMSAGVSVADDLHYNNILIGDRASGMGGAYTGISDDPAGLYYNPAGIVYSTGRSLSASVNAYHSLTKTYEGVLGGNDWNRDSAALLPNFFGIIQPLGSKVKVGFSYAVPDSILEDQDQTFFTIPASLGNATFIDRFVINFNNEDNTYNYGPSLALKVSEELSAGMTLYVHQRRAQTINNQLVNLSDGRVEWSNVYSETNEFGLKPVVGVMWAPFKKVSLGLSAAKVLVINSDRTDQITFKGIDYAKDSVDRIVTTTDEKREYPYEFRAGLGYFQSEGLIVSGDVSYYTSTKDETFGDREWVMNAALGTEYYMNKNWAMRGGLFTNVANTAEVEAGKTGQAEHINIYGGSLSLSHFTRNTSVTLGGNLSYGAGEAQVIRGSTDVQDVTTMSWTAFLSSSYSY